MSDFYTSEHCVTRVHCGTCRALDGGRTWRRQLVVVFADLTGEDFACQAGLPWGYRPPREESCRPGSHFDKVRRRIDAAPDRGGWVNLKEQLRVHLEMMALHSDHSPCWHARQQLRIVSYYQTARQKGLLHTP